MAYCGPLGIAHSEFLSWDDLDQDKAIAWLGFEKSRCPGCNTFPHEYLDDEGRVLNQPPYIVYSERCYGCVGIEDKNKEIGANKVGYHLRMIPNPKYRG